jgi:hypothetical protein
LNNPIEKVAVPEALKKMRLEHEVTVNEALIAREHELVLIHWHDMEEHSDICQFGGGLKNKYPYEAECIAVGITTGHPATSFYRNVKYQHYVWALPVKKMWKLVLSPEMKATPDYPKGQISGAFPELPHLRNNNQNQHGKAEFANFPWWKRPPSPTNVGGSHLSLEAAESMNYQPFSEDGNRMRCERAVQVVVGHHAVMTWLQGRLENYLTDKQVRDCLIPDIHRLTGYDWSCQKAA